MKKFFLLMVFASLAISLQATIINVSNNSTRPAGYQQYLQVAIDNATAGDTIYVYPSNVSYGNITVTKRLYFFGSGYSGSPSTSYESTLGQIYLDTTTSPSSNPSGTSFMGFKFESNFSTNKPNIKNITIYGNWINGNISLNVNCNNWLISNNVIGNVSFNVNQSGSVIISNNVISGNISNSSAPSVVISNNTFFHFGYYSNLNGISNATISNNIFLVTSTSNGGQSNCVFLNNITWYNATSTYNFPGAGNTGSGNLNNTMPVFMTGAFTNTTFDPSIDYHLAAGSPGKNGGSDGTDIGHFGGTAPFVWQTAASIPRVTNITITNPVINQATPINVKVKAKKASL